MDVVVAIALNYLYSYILLKRSIYLILKSPNISAPFYLFSIFSKAITVLMLIADVSFMIALTDAIVEPLANAVWYFLLDKFWASKVSKS